MQGPARISPRVGMGSPTRGSRPLLSRTTTVLREGLTSSSSSMTTMGDRLTNRIIRGSVGWGEEEEGSTMDLMTTLLPLLLQ